MKKMMKKAIVLGIALALTINGSAWASASTNAAAARETEIANQLKQAQDLYGNSKYAQAYDLYTSLREESDIAAYNSAYMLIRGLGVNADRAQGLSIYRKLAVAGYTPAQFAYVYASINYPVSHDTVIDALTIGVEKKLAPAILYAAAIYEGGFAAARDMEKAAESANGFIQMNQSDKIEALSKMLIEDQDYVLSYPTTSKPKSSTYVSYTPMDQQITFKRAVKTTTDNGMIVPVFAAETQELYRVTRWKYKNYLTITFEEELQTVK